MLSLLRLFGVGLLALSRPSSGTILPRAALNVSVGLTGAVAEADSKLVFAHFMIGITSDRTSASDYDDDMKRAKALGIDAFALNIGVDDFTDTQLGFAYDSANNNGMKVFISFDFAWWSTGSGSAVGSKIAAFASRPAQLLVNNKVFVSSFIGDGVDVNAIRSAAGRDIYFAPNFHPGQGDFSVLDGALSWQAWQTNGANRAPDGTLVTVDSGDKAYASALGGKGYIAPVSPWFSTHFGNDVSFTKNWVFPGDLLLYRRWLEILALQPTFIELATWNDYGESHYMGPLASKHADDGSSKWANDMPHTGWLDLSAPFIAAYKAGSQSVNNFITDEKIIYWYRITPKDLNCDSTDSAGGRPEGSSTAFTDEVFVVSLLKSAGTVTVNSAGTVYTFNAPAGASAFSVPFKIGTQSFGLSRNGQSVFSATSLKQIQNTCPCGIYNFNAYVGTVPESARDVLGPDGLAAFSRGLHVACDATPSLPATPPATVAPTTTIAASAAPTSTPV